jgi:hypothetical protein
MLARRVGNWAFEAWASDVDAGLGTLDGGDPGRGQWRLQLSTSSAAASSQQPAQRRWQCRDSGFAADGRRAAAAIAREQYQSQLDRLSSADETAASQRRAPPDSAHRQRALPSSRRLRHRCHSGPMATQEQHPPPPRLQPSVWPVALPRARGHSIPPTLLVCGVSRPAQPRQPGY